MSRPGYFDDFFDLPRSVSSPVPEYEGEWYDKPQDPYDQSRVPGLGDLPIDPQVAANFAGYLGDTRTTADGAASNASTAIGQAGAAQVTATAAIAAATAANNTVLALINGGTRTVYTSNFTYAKPANLVKLGIILFGGGGAGAAGRTAAGGTGGGYLYFELAASEVPATITGNVSAGRSAPVSASGDTTPNPSSVTVGAATVSSPVGNKGLVVSGAAPQDATGAAPGSGGANGVTVNNISNGLPGGSSALAAGGAGGVEPSSRNGGAGANAPTDQQYMAGGGGGGGGSFNSGFNGSGGNGGAGGFPGGAGGAGGGGFTGNWSPGPGAPGCIALVEFKS